MLPKKPPSLATLRRRRDGALSLSHSSSEGEKNELRRHITFSSIFWQLERGGKAKAPIKVTSSLLQKQWGQPTRKFNGLTHLSLRSRIVVKKSPAITSLCHALEWNSLTHSLGVEIGFALTSCVRNIFSEAFSILRWRAAAEEKKKERREGKSY